MDKPMRLPFLAEAHDVLLSGWLQGEGIAVVLLHGGPGLSYQYLDDLADELGNYSVASYQQRGLAPSTREGPFTIADRVVRDPTQW